jgi:hypothetical protein
MKSLRSLQGSTRQSRSSLFYAVGRSQMGIAPRSCSFAQDWYVDGQRYPSDFEKSSANAWLDLSIFLRVGSVGEEVLLASGIRTSDLHLPRPSLFYLQLLGEFLEHACFREFFQIRSPHPWKRESQTIHSIEFVVLAFIEKVRRDSRMP